MHRKIKSGVTEKMLFSLCIMHLFSIYWQSLIDYAWCMHVQWSDTIIFIFEGGKFVTVESNITPQKLIPYNRKFSQNFVEIFNTLGEVLMILCFSMWRPHPRQSISCTVQLHVWHHNFSIHLKFCSSYSCNTQLIHKKQQILHHTKISLWYNCYQDDQYERVHANQSAFNVMWIILAIWMSLNMHISCHVHSNTHPSHIHYWKYDGTHSHRTHIFARCNLIPFFLSQLCWVQSHHCVLSIDQEQLDVGTCTPLVQMLTIIWYYNINAVILWSPRININDFTSQIHATSWTSTSTRKFLCEPAVYTKLAVTSVAVHTICKLLSGSSSSPSSVLFK